jgi:hypothetical protein
LAEAIASFLRECDRRKFSLIHLNTPLKAVDRALELVGLAEQRRAWWSAQAPGPAAAPRADLSEASPATHHPGVAAPGKTGTTS